MYHLFKNAAEYCQETYGCEIIEEDGQFAAFVCPTCGEPIYFVDWSDSETENWLMCPICMEWFGDEEEKEE